MQATLAAGARLLIVGSVLAAVALGQESAVQETKWDDGTPRERYEVIRDADGAEVRHGTYAAWHANGELAAEGAYENGLRSGSWKVYNEKGRRREVGHYEAGLREGKWKLYDEKGKLRGEGAFVQDRYHGPWTFAEDPAESGDYRWTTLRYPDGSVRGEGYLKDGRLHGPWVYAWEDGSVQFAGRYRSGRREGTWIFRHADGTYDPELLSGVYAAGERTGPAPSGELPDFAVPFERPTNGGGHGAEAREAADDRELQHLLDLAAKGRGERRDEAFAELAARRAEVVPALIDRLHAVDRDNPRAIAQAVRAYGGILAAMCNGASYPFEHAGGEADGDSLLVATRRWSSLWALTGGTDFWELDAPLLDPEDPRALWLPPFPDLDANTEGGRWFASDGARALYAGRFDELEDEDVARALKEALEWLHHQQERHGGWDADAFSDDAEIKGVQRMAYHDVGVSALACLAYLAAGNTTREGPHKEDLARGLAWIGAQLRDNGSIESLLPEAELGYDQALAALALCEAAALSPSPTLASKARTAVEWILRARNPDAAWRYTSLPTGENDTSITAWMVQVLFAARRADLGVDDARIDAALAGAKVWIQSVSERRTGRVGYNDMGTHSVRVPQNEHYPREKGEPLTAAGLFCHALFGTDRTEEILPRHVFRIRKAPPRWSQDGLSNDMYYWFFANHALHQFGGEAWETWWKEWRELALRSQRKQGEERGSWQPIGPWGFVGGRVYSTAIMALGLAVPQRLPQLYEDEGKRSQSSRKG